VKLAPPAAKDKLKATILTLISVIKGQPLSSSLKSAVKNPCLKSEADNIEIFPI
jgi:hypothetical protein